MLDVHIMVEGHETSSASNTIVVQTPSPAPVQPSTHTSPSSSSSSNAIFYGGAALGAGISAVAGWFASHDESDKPSASISTSTSNTTTTISDVEKTTYSSTHRDTTREVKGILKDTGYIPRRVPHLWSL